MCVCLVGPLNGLCDTAFLLSHCPMSRIVKYTANRSQHLLLQIYISAAPPKSNKETPQIGISLCLSLT